jgi:gluconokinase
MLMAASPRASDLPARPRLSLVVMGVSGTGKSAVAEGLSAALGLGCHDGDDLHAPEKVAKMRAGIPLQDEDRWPWLDRIGGCLAQAAAPGAVVSCSALRRSHRDRIRHAAPGVRFIFLYGNPALIRERMQRRSGHFMPASLLESQLQTLEWPCLDERDVVSQDITAPVAAVVAQAVAALGVATSAMRA